MELLPTAWSPMKTILNFIVCFLWVAKLSYSSNLVLILNLNIIKSSALYFPYFEPWISLKWPSTSPSPTVSKGLPAHLINPHPVRPLKLATGWESTNLLLRWESKNMCQTKYRRPILCKNWALQGPQHKKAKKINNSNHLRSFMIFCLCVKINLFECPKEKLGRPSPNKSMSDLFPMRFKRKRLQTVGRKIWR